MRASSRKGDPGYNPNAKYDVFLDGVALDRVITADEERGEILQSAVDDSGNCIINGNEFVEVILRGRVEIRSRDPERLVGLQARNDECRARGFPPERYGSA